MTWPFRESSKTNDPRHRNTAMLYRITVVLALLAHVSALNVAVTGATGRTGRLVVDSLLSAGHTVTALVRDDAKAKETLPASVVLKTIDLAQATGGEMRAACADAEKLIWCASGFTESGESIDMLGMKLVPFMDKIIRSAKDGAPGVIMLSSAGVTRPAWDDAKKARLVGASDIPIINLNPGGILGKKCIAEETLRASGVPYCVVRPTGLKFDGSWPEGRPLLSQGDVAVGRTTATDLAALLVDVLGEGEATGKTFEMFTLAGYPPARDLAPALAKLSLDAAGPLPEAAVDATYAALQQCLPGEEQDATKLEMGRTYEQVDEGVVVPRTRGAAPTQREQDLAAGVAGGAKRTGIRGLLRKVLRRA